VQYPASSPNVLAVAAIGRLNEYPDDSWDASTVVPTLVAGDGTFSPSFTCHGPQIGVCAPGVGIVSTIPGGYEPQSGTSMAAPHVTGLASLLLAHHPVFRGPLRARNAHRVAGLFSLIRSICKPSPFGAERAGSGLPSLEGIAQVLLASGASSEAATRGAATGATGQPVQPAALPSSASATPQAGAFVTAQSLQPGAAQFAPQGAFGQQLGGMLGGLGGGLMGHGTLGTQLGAALGNLLPFQAGSQFGQQGTAGGPQTGWGLGGHLLAQAALAGQLGQFPFGCSLQMTPQGVIWNTPYGGVRVG
jgi:hypothetical protein